MWHYLCGGMGICFKYCIKILLDSLNKRTAKLVQVSYPLDFSWTGTEYKVGPISDLSGDLYVLPGEGGGGVHG